MARRAVKTQLVIMLIHPRAPFNFAQTLRFILAPPALLNGRQFAPLLDYLVDGEYRRVLELGEQLILYGVREEGPPANPALRVRILAGPDDDRAQRAVATEVERQFSTGLDLQPFYTRAEADPVLRQLIVHFQGMRVPQAPRVFEILISAIIEQQVNLSFAHKVKKFDGAASIALERTPDVLAALGARKGDTFLVGFAAETDDHERNARHKLSAKHLDAIALNDVSGGAGFGTGDDELVLLWGESGRKPLGNGAKAELARALWDALAGLRGGA